MDVTSAVIFISHNLILFAFFALAEILQSNFKPHNLFTDCWVCIPCQTKRAILKEGLEVQEKCSHVLYMHS